MNATPVLATDRATPAETLRHAALYLGWAGWEQGDYYSEALDPTPPADVVGAIAMAVYGQRVDTPHCDVLARFVIEAEDVLRDYLRTQALDTFPPLDYPGSVDDRDAADVLTDLYVWNDAPWQTRANVINTLNAAATDYDCTPGGAA